MNHQSIYVVQFNPFDDRAGFGGFDWFYSLDLAMNRFNEYCKDNTHEIRVVSFETNLSDRDKIAQEIDNCLDDLIMSPMAEFIPSS